MGKRAGERWLFDKKNEESKGRTLLAAVRKNDYGEADEYAAAAANTGRKAAARGNAVVSEVHHLGGGSRVRLDGEKMGEGRLGAMGQCWPQRKRQAEHRVLDLKYKEVDQGNQRQN